MAEPTCQSFGTRLLQGLPSPLPKYSRPSRGKTGSYLSGWHVETIRINPAAHRRQKPGPEVLLGPGTTKVPCTNSIAASQIPKVNSEACIWGTVAGTATSSERAHR